MNLKKFLITAVNAQAWRWFCRAMQCSLVIGCLASCSKENIAVNTGKPEWMRVLSDTIFSSTDDELFQGRNGKILSDDAGNLYLYYFQGILHQSVVVKCNAQGDRLWQKAFPNCEPMDMVLTGSDLVLAVRLSPLQPRGIVLYIVHPDGSEETKTLTVWETGYDSHVNNVCMFVMPDHSLVLSGSYFEEFYPNTSTSTNCFIKRLNTALDTDWTFLMADTATLYNGAFGQNSIIPLSTNQFLFEYSLTRNLTDSTAYELRTGVMSSAGNISEMHDYYTGSRTPNAGYGFSNRYCNGLIQQGNSSIYHFSSPDIFKPPGPARPNGFLEIDNHGLVTDTIDIPLPAGYRILSCTTNKGSFLISAYKEGLASGTNDYSASQTLFLYGHNWITATSFTVQGFYADFFPSSVATSDGGYVMMGKIQSFNRTANKLVLVKWKMEQ